MDLAWQVFTFANISILYISYYKPTYPLDITLCIAKANNKILNERNKSLTVNGTYTDSSADFDINKLNISILDSNDYIKISQKKLTSKGNFSFLVSLNNSKLEEIKTLNNYKIPLSEWIN